MLSVEAGARAPHGELPSSPPQPLIVDVRDAACGDCENGCEVSGPVVVLVRAASNEDMLSGPALKRGS